MEHVALLSFALVFAVMASAGATAQADVKMPSIFGDNMVLQQGMPLPVWGTAAPGEKITVAFGTQKQTVVADKAGKWMVSLKSVKAGGPFEMTVSGRNVLTFKNVLVGEVWIASGQSNMQMAVKQVEDAEKEIAAAGLPTLRLCSVARIGAPSPQDDLYADWVECSPDVVGRFSAVAYFFARKLHKDLDVPVGIIHDSWSGSLIETWISRETLEALPQAQPLLAAWDKAVTLSGAAEKAAEEKYQSQLADWRKDYAKAEHGQKPDAPSWDESFDPAIDFQRPSGNYNGMIAPLVPYAIRGAIWYQGEGNSERAAQYRALFPALISDWRRLWHEGDLPFLFVQISSYREAPGEPYDSEWAQLREAQVMTLKVKNTGMAVSLDCGDERDPHFKKKRPVGERLALVAEGEVYGRKVAWWGPMYESMKAEGGAIRLKFDHVGEGLVARGADELHTFQIAGADRKFVWAKASIDKDTVVVRSAQVAKPVAVRYAWMDNALAANLYNKEGLPASSFRTDTWPVSTDGILVWPAIDDFVKRSSNHRDTEAQRSTENGPKP